MIITAFHISPGTVRLVKSKSHFTSIEFLCCDEQNYGTGSSTLSEAISVLCARNNSAGSRIIPAIPSEKIIIKTVTFPFSDERKIKELVPVEAEEIIPVSIDKLTIVHQILSKSPDNCTVMIAACRTDYLEEFKRNFAEAGAQLSAVYLEPNALFSLRTFHKEASSNAVQIDFGDSRIIINSIENSKLSGFKIIQKGSDDFYALFSNAGLSAVERSKIIARHDSPANSGRSNSAKAKHLAVTEKYLNLTEKIVKTVSSHLRSSSPECIHLSGSNPFAQTLASGLFTELEIPVYDFSAETLIKNFKGRNYETACGTILCSQLSPKQADFLAQNTTGSELFKELKPAVFFTILSASVFTAYLIFSTILLMSKGSGDSTEMRDLFKKYFRKEPSSGDVISEAENILKNEKKQIEGISAVVPEKKPILLNLENMLRFYTPDPSFSMKDIILTSDSVIVKGEISDISKIDEFRKRLTQSGYFSSADLNTAYSGKDGTKFTLTVKTKGESKSK